MSSLQSTVSLDQRSADVLSELTAADASGGEASGGSLEPAGEAVAAPATEGSTETHAATAGDAEARKVARKAALDELRAKSKAKQRRPEAPAQGDNARLAQLEAELAAAKAQAGRLSELKDPAKLVRLLRDEGVAPEVLGEYLRTGGDPAELASKSAREALMPEFADIKEKLAAQAAELETLRAERQQEQFQTVQQRETGKLLAALSELKQDFPRTDKFRELIGTDSLVALAKTIGANMPAGANYEQLLGLTEEYFDALAPVFAAGPPAKNDPPRAATNPRAPVLSNDVAAARSQVGAETEVSRNFDERARDVTEWLRTL